MERNDFFRTTEAMNSDGSACDKSLMILAVGAPREWRGRAHLPANETELAFVDFDDVTADLIERVRPQVILSPLLALSFDCFDLAVVLRQIGFTGQYRAVGRDLPRPEIVVREIRQLCPKIDFDILIDT